MPDAHGKPTEAEVMTGFNPDRSRTAEQLEAEAAAQEGAEVQVAHPEGEATPETPPPAPTEVEITLDGRRVKAPRDIADAFTREINRRDGTRGAELQTLRERLARLEGATAAHTEVEVPDAPQVPNPEMQIENPVEYQRQLLAFVAHQQEKRTTALADQYVQAEAAKDQEAARRAAWTEHCNTFYGKPENAVLRDNRDIVDLVLEQHRRELAPLSVEDGFAELSRLTKERLSRLTGVAPELRGRRAAKPPVLEGSARRDSALAPAAEEAGPTSLTAALKERRKLAAESFAKGGSGRPTVSR